MRSIKQTKYSYRSIKAKHTYLFCFLSKKIKKKEYLFYQKCYEKYYGRPCDVSYKKFWRMMLRKSIIWWLICLTFPIIFIWMLIWILATGGFGASARKNRKKNSLSDEESLEIYEELEKQWAEEDKLSTKKKRYIYEPIKIKNGYFFCFFSKKNKKREYICYQKCYEKYYGKTCNVSYKKFWRMMLRKSITYWLLSVFSPVLIILFIIDMLSLNPVISSIGNYRSKRTLNSEEIIAIRDELQKQWDEEDRLEALQKEVEKNKI